MLYCDLTVNGNVLYTGMVCENNKPIGNYPYLGFIGQLGFVDTQGNSDPTSPGLDSRFVLIYVLAGQNNLIVPLKDVPSQQLSIVLGTQNCVISLYLQ
jgi:hypothetical protein